MVRKRIKTIAQELGISVQDVLASCGRLRLLHANSESSLLSSEQTKQVKAEIDARAPRTVLLRRETVAVRLW
jgi:hypothetical protein